MPQAHLVRDLPSTLNPKALHRALERFVFEVDVKGDNVGFVQQTLETIASATYLRVPGQDFWLAEAGGEVAGYLLARVVRDIDGSLCYWVSQAWCAPEFRRTPFVKESLANVRQKARENLCRYIVYVGSRNPKAYMRFLGQGTHLYSTLLKQDL
jgi:hypothetical protein